MKIDGNELAIKQNELDQQGFKQEAYEMKMEFLRQVRERRSLSLPGGLSAPRQLL